MADGSMTTPRERPILFSAPMVRAILAGKKTQTRRIVKAPKVASLHGRHSVPERHFFDRGFGDGSYVHWFYGGGDLGNDTQSVRVWCPYGKAGDRLWVKETWRASSSGRHHPTRATQIFVEYREQSSSRGAERGRQHQAHWECSDEEHDELCRKAYGSASAHAWRPSLFMPRWASRITLEITGVRAEPLHALTEADAAAEGVEPAPFCKAGRAAGLEHVEAFEELWCEINGAESWAANPWVWVVEFKRVKT